MIVRMVEEGRSWVDIERATGSNAFDRYYCVLNPALKDSWTPVRIDQLSRMVQGHVDKWAVEQLVARPEENSNNNNLSVLVLNVDHIPWRDVALAFQESGSICTRIWIEFGNGRPLLDQGRQTNQGMEVSEQEGARKEKEDAQKKEQAGREEQSRQESGTQGEVLLKKDLSQSKKGFIRGPVPSDIPKTSEPTNGLIQETPSIAPKSPSPTNSLPQYTPRRVQASRLRPPGQDKPTHPQSSNKGTGKGHTNNSSNIIMRRTRLNSCNIKNAELQTAQRLRQDRVLQNMQRIKLVGVQRSHVAAQRDQERVVLLEKQDAVKKQYDSLRVDSDDITSPWPASRSIVFPRTLTTPFRPPLFPRYSVQSATPRGLHHDIDASSSTSSAETYVFASPSESRKDICAVDQPLPGLSGALLDSPANLDTTILTPHNTSSTTLPTISSSAMEEIFVDLLQDGTGRHTPIVSTNTDSDTVSNGQKDPVSHVLTSSNITETPSGQSTSLNEFRIPSIADVLAEYSFMVDRTVGNKRYWATTNEDTIKRLRAKSEDIRSAFLNLSSRGSSTRPPLGNDPTSPP